MDLIATICYFRQFQKEVKVIDGEECIECDLEDYRIAYELTVGSVLSSTLYELTKNTRDFHQRLVEIAKEEAQRLGINPMEVTLTQRQIRERTGLANTWVKDTIRTLCDFQYLKISRGGKRGMRGEYQLCDESAIKGMDFSMIPTVEELAKRIKEAKTPSK